MRNTLLSSAGLAPFSLLLALTACGGEDFNRPTPDKNEEDAGPDTCVPSDALCPVEFTLPLGSATSVELRGDFAPGAWEKGLSMSIDGAVWRTTVSVPNGTTIQYKFFINGSEWINDPGNGNKIGDNSAKVGKCGEVCKFECPTVGTFDWRSAVMYFVFVDRFRNGDASNDLRLHDSIDPSVQGPADYQGGDWKGVIDKIDDGYFESLGVNALWLTVPMNNPNLSGAGADGRSYSAYHGYWPSDLEATEEHFGDMALLRSLVDKAHARGIKVLVDYAMNHVHKDAQVFKEHPDWFWPLDNGGKSCVCGDGCSWDNDEGRRCWFRDYLPDWNFTVPAARKASVDNAIWWIKETGIDGFRLDAVKHIEFSWISDLRKRLCTEVEPASGEHFYTVGETFAREDRGLIKSYLGPELLDGQFDFPQRGVAVEKIARRTGSMAELDAFLATNDSFYGPSAIMSTFIGNHDIPRVVHSAEDYFSDKPWPTWDAPQNTNWDNTPGLPGNKPPFERLAVAFTFLLTTKGIPLIYYGDEVGLPGSADPDNRRFMHWNDYPDSKPYSEGQAFLLDRVKKLGQIRKAHPALWRGTRQTLEVAEHTYVYRMVDLESGDDVYVALNRSDELRAVKGMPASGTDLLTDKAVTGPQANLPARSSMIVIPKK